MWDDIDFANNTLSVNRQVQMNENTKHWTFHNPKYDSFRTIKLDTFTINLLKKEKELQENSVNKYNNFYTHLYVNSNNEINTESGKEIKMITIRENGTYIQPRIMQHVGRVIHGKDTENSPVISKLWDFHSLRHTHATMLLEAGANPKEVQHRLGHKNIKVTLDIYSHLTEKMQEDAVDIINKIF